MTYRRPHHLDQYVMDMLEASNCPLGAYDIAHRSCKTGSPLAPSQVYRILTRLIERGRVRRVALLSAYAPVSRTETGLSVCRGCDTVAPIDCTHLSERLRQLCKTTGFSPAVPILEVSGLCPRCRSDRAQVRSSRPRRADLMLTAVLTVAIFPPQAPVGAIFGGIGVDDPHPLPAAERHAHYISQNSEKDIA